MSEEKKSTVIWKDRKHILWFPFSFEKYRVANGRIYCQHGLVNQREHECLLYRILDISLKRSLLNLMCGTGTVVMRTTDDSDPDLVLKNIKRSHEVKDMLSDLIEKDRIRRGVTGREIIANGPFTDGEDFDGDFDGQ